MNVQQTSQTQYVQNRTQSLQVCPISISSLQNKWVHILFNCPGPKTLELSLTPLPHTFLHSIHKQVRLVLPPKCTCLLLTISTPATLIRTTIIFHLDHCNSFLIGLSFSTISLFGTASSWHFYHSDFVRTSQVMPFSPQNPTVAPYFTRSKRQVLYNSYQVLHDLPSFSTWLPLLIFPLVTSL